MSSRLLAEVAPIVDDVVIVANGRLVGQPPLADLTAERVAVEDLLLELTEDT